MMKKLKIYKLIIIIVLILLIYFVSTSFYRYYQAKSLFSQIEEFINEEYVKKFKPPLCYKIRKSEIHYGIFYAHLKYIISVNKNSYPFLNYNIEVKIVYNEFYHFIHLFFLKGFLLLNKIIFGHNLERIVAYIPPTEKCNIGKDCLITKLIKKQTLTPEGKMQYIFHSKWNLHFEEKRFFTHITKSIFDKKLLFIEENETEKEKILYEEYQELKVLGEEIYNIISSEEKVKSKTQKEL